MKNRNVILTSILAVSISAALSIPITSVADEMFAVAPSSVYQVVKNASLQASLTQVSTRSGIVFKINAEIGKDVVRQNLSAANWETAVKSLLQDYNYTLVTDGKVLKTVIVTGHHGSGAGVEPTHITAATDPLDYNAPIVIDPKMGKLPKTYDSFPAGSVMAIDLPMKEIMGLGKGQTTSISSPLGQFNVTHDNSVSESDGSTTFVGHMTDEGQGYRMILSQGPAGIIGSITTPEGNFNIENQNGATVLIDTGKLTHAGFEGDTAVGVIAPAVGAGLIAACPVVGAATALTTAQLTTAVTAAQTAVTTATARVTTAQTALTAANLKLTAANTAGVTRLATVKSATTTYNTGKASAATAAITLATAQTAQAKVAAQASFNTLNAKLVTYASALTKAKAAYTSALAVITRATTAVTAAQSALTTANATLTTANMTLAAAKDALAGSTTPPVTPSATTAGNVIDIMVEYATDQVTAAFAQQRIAMLVTASNQAYLDSGINLTLRLVYSEATTYPSQNSNSGALTALTNGTGVFSTVAAKRIQYGADLVYLFRPLNALTQANCGNAYVEMAKGSAANPALGYGIISDGTSKDAASGSYCGINAFTHEIGHSMGLVHDRANSTVYGATPYSYAWAVPGVFGTIMSYSYPVVMYFSTPVLAAKTSTGAPQTCNGQPCGYAKTDAARMSDQVLTANATVPVIAAFMPTKVK